MKKHLLLILIVCFTLVGCNGGNAEKGRVDIKGIIKEVDYEGNKILVEDKHEGLVWVALQENGDISKYLERQEVVVWIKGGIRESFPAQADALNIEFTNPKD
ncbi:YobA family protein [Bacillus sp. sid0103]|uniref:DUF3221 domain-containing protein n=1 Tax=Bacillus sp. sid0103 TaxID=2856337 RepID=UPI001C438A12|nr:DUF3221 domain-containing protein [Bacillus sp. sid0103]MBV7506692.1 YobA family protein [Bacillus sp. sid0103]